MKLEFKKLKICGECRKEAKYGCIHHNIIETNAISIPDLHEWAEKKHIHVMTATNLEYRRGFNQALAELKLELSEIK